MDDLDCHSNLAAENDVIIELSAEETAGCQMLYDYTYETSSHTSTLLPQPQCQSREQTLYEVLPDTSLVFQEQQHQLEDMEMDASDSLVAPQYGPGFPSLPSSPEDEVMPSSVSVQMDERSSTGFTPAVHGEDHLINAKDDFDIIQAETLDYLTRQHAAPWPLREPTPGLPMTVPIMHPWDLLEISSHSPVTISRGPPRVFKVRSAAIPYELLLSTPGRLEDISGVCKQGLQEIGRSKVGDIVEWRKELSLTF